MQRMGDDKGGNGGGVEWKMNVTCTGPTKTDFNGNRAPPSVEVAAKNTVRLAVLENGGETGTMSSKFKRRCSPSVKTVVRPWPGNRLRSTESRARSTRIDDYSVTVISVRVP
jgi:hypothetical protein